MRRPAMALLILSFAAAPPGAGPSSAAEAPPAEAPLLDPAASPASARGAEEAPPAAVEAEPGIRIRVTGLRSDDGRLACGLFVEDNWLRAGAVDGKGGEIREGVAECRFPGVEPGAYAVSTFHDENGNGRLDTGFMRIPKEGTAASNNAYRRFGPPRYRDARFDYRGGVLELEAQMRYLR